MKKSKFICSILASIVVCGSTAQAYYYTVDYQENGTEYKNIVTILSEKVSLNQGNWKSYGSVGYPRPDGDVTVQDAVLTLDGVTSNLEYVTANSNGNGMVLGSSTLNVKNANGSQMLVGGPMTLNWCEPAGGFHTNAQNPNPGQPYSSTEDTTINVYGNSKVYRIYGGAFTSGYKTDSEIGFFTQRGNVYINVYEDATVTSDIRGGGGSLCSVDAKVSIHVHDNAHVAKIYGGARGGNSTKSAYVKSTEITIEDNAHVSGNVYGGGSYDEEYANVYTQVLGSTTVNIKGGTLEKNVYGGGDNDTVNSTNVTISGTANVKGDVFGGGENSIVEEGINLTIEGGTIEGNVYAGSHAISKTYTGANIEDHTVEKRGINKGDTKLILKGGTVKKAIYGSGIDDTTEGSVTVQILGGDWTDTEIHGKAENAEVKGGTKLIVGAEGVTYNGELGSISGFDSVVVAKGSALNLQSGNIFDVTEHSYTITADNLGENGLAITTVSPDAEVSVDKPITLNFATEGRVLSGRYKIIDATQADPANVDTTTNWDSGHVSVNGKGASFEGLVWDGQTLYLDYVSPVVDAAMAGNWGVFKASQAFTGTLWGNRTNACVLSKPAAATDAKGVAITPVPTGVTLAWGTVYGQSARISGVGADYSLYGGAIGVEHQFASGRSIGAALGYDWGEVSPFGGSKIDQESFHAAVYGRAGIWQVSSNSAVAVDWSAAFGDTTSENDVVNGDWSQDSLQLDARVSYLRKLNDRTTGSLFAGMQYFAADSDTVDGLEVSSMQNLRAEIGAGISYQLTQKATVYGEASVYNDLMRHNPYVADAGQHFKGTNPGRTGGSLNVGVQYDLNADWTVRGGYSFDVAEDSTEHNINAGAVYKF